MTGRFVALEGVDGCGKTTLARSVADVDLADGPPPVAGGGQVVFVSRRTVPPGDGFAARLMRQNAWMLWESGDATDLSPEFWVTLQASWYTAMTDAVIGPLLDRGHDVVLDGWMYKFWSKLLNQGYTEDELHVIFRGARVPDHVVLVDADVQAVFERGRDFRPTELGMHVGYAELNMASFVDYQTRGLDNLYRLAKTHGWSTLKVPAQESVDRTTARLSELVSELLNEGEQSSIS